MSDQTKPFLPSRASFKVSEDKKLFSFLFNFSALCVENYTIRKNIWEMSVTLCLSEPFHDF